MNEVIIEVRRILEEKGISVTDEEIKDYYKKLHKPYDNKTILIIDIVTILMENKEGRLI